MYGFLRKTKEQAEKAGPDLVTGVCRTGLDEYLEVIFPGVEWIHDKTTGLLDHGKKSRRRPDYRSEELKMIVEFDGIQHYTSPLQIEKDYLSTCFYEHYGYKVVRIPYFIQLSNNAVKTLFGVDVDVELFDESLPSLNVEDKCCPSFLCSLGVERMAHEFRSFPEQYFANINHLDTYRDIYSGKSLLERAYKDTTRLVCFYRELDDVEVV